jgi:uncharacterized protein YjbI with pentapeptide repeats
MKAPRVPGFRPVFPILVLFLTGWMWALFSTPDSRLAIRGEIVFPVGDIVLPCALFLIISPLAAVALSLGAAANPGPRSRIPAGLRALILPTGVLAALSINAIRAVIRHDPALSVAAVLLAAVGAVLVCAAWFRSRTGFGVRRRGRALFPAGMAAAFCVLDAFILFALIPWAGEGLIPTKSPFRPFNEHIRPLYAASLAGCLLSSLPGTNLRGARLEGADLHGAGLDRLDLRGARLRNARMDKASLAGTVLAGSDIVQVLFDYADLRGADLSGTLATGARAIGADLRGASFRGGFLHYLKLHYCDADGADFSDADLAWGAPFGSRFRGADFRRAKLPGLALIRVDFEDADLRDADLHGAEFLKTNLRGANLAGADLRGVVGLDAGQLCTVKSLRGARLDPGLLEEVRRRKPGVFEGLPGTSD